MIVRARTGDDLVSRLIRAREGPVNPAFLGFVPSHVELAGFTTPDGTPGYLGAHDDGGIAVRPEGYDAKGLTGEAFFDVQLPDEQAARDFALAKIGTPYDWRAILGFVLPIEHAHQYDHAICSAFVSVVLERGLLFPRHPLAKPPWARSPLDVAFLLSAMLTVGVRQTVPKAA